MGTRHCFIISPTKIIGASAIIGDSCSGFPIWTVPCDDQVLTDQTCGGEVVAEAVPAPVSLGGQECGAVVLSPVAATASFLSEPVEKVFA